MLYHIYIGQGLDSVLSKLSDGLRPDLLADDYDRAGLCLWKEPDKVVRYGDHLREFGVIGLQYVVAVDAVPVMPDFDIDYEHDGHLALEFICHREAEVRKMTVALASRGVILSDCRKITLVDGKRRRMISCEGMSLQDCGMGQGEIIADIMHRIASVNEAFFAEFVKESLKLADAVRYTGYVGLPVKLTVSLDTFRKSQKIPA